MAAVDRALQEQDEKNADYSKKQELAAQLQGEAAALLEALQ